MRISMYTVRTKRLTNRFIREKMEIRNITDYVRKRQLDWLNHLAKEYIKDESNRGQTEGQFRQHKLLFAWSDSPRQRGQPQRNLRTAYKECLSEIYPDLPKDGDFKMWRPDVQRGNFKERIEGWWERTHPTQQKQYQRARAATRTASSTQQTPDHEPPWDPLTQGGLIPDSIDYNPTPIRLRQIPVISEPTPSGLIPDSVEHNPPGGVEEWWERRYPNQRRTRSMVICESQSL